ncbi:MAG: HD domain-containing protein [Spirochaetales bacterium]|nr:HD domain-containing protein [Spirochaetales bacterium]
MKEISVSELQTGDYFDSPVFLDDAFILLSPDTPVTEELIQRLKQWGYENVLCDGRVAQAPAYTSSGAAATAVSVLDMDIREKQEIEEARKLYYALVNFTLESFKKFKEDGKLNIPRVSERIKLLIDMVKSSRDAILRYAEFSYPSENYMYVHSVNSAILALAIGDLMKLPPHRMIELGLGALLHDIGMLKLPDAVYLKEENLSEKEFQIVRAHTTLGYKILKSFSVAEEIALAAEEHHERLDGSGYPKALSGEEISLYSRIVAVVCSYDAITSKRLFKTQNDPHAAVMELLKERNTKYDEAVVRSLIVCLSAYPLGSLVLLSDESIGRVTKINPESPRFPFVQVLIDGEGGSIEEPLLIKTAESDGVSIQRCLSPQEAEKLDL